MMNRLTETTAIALIFSLSILSNAQAFTQPNSVSPAYTASMAAQAAAGRAASQTTIAAPALTAALAAQQAAAKAATQVTIAAPAYTAALVAQAAAGRAASQATLAAAAYAAALVAQAAAGRAASQTTLAAPAYTAALAAQAAAGRAASSATIAAPGGTFAVPNVKATIATGPISVPKPGSYYSTYGVDSSGDVSQATVTIPANAAIPLNLPDPTGPNGLPIVPYPNGNSNPDPNSSGVIIQSSIPPQFNLGLPTQSVPWSTADRQQAQTMLVTMAGMLIVGPVVGGYGAAGAGLGGSGAGAGAGVTVQMFGSAAGLSQLIDAVH